MQAVAPQTSDITVMTRGITVAAANPSAYAGYQIIRRNGAVVGFEPNKIAVALSAGIEGLAGVRIGAA